MERWRQHYHELLNTGITNNSNSEGLMLTQEKTVQIREQDKIQAEVTEIVSALKRGKSAGHDGIAAEMLKHMGDSGTEMFTELLNKAWEEKQIPDDWKIGIIIPIHKKGDSMDCNNYRGITLLSVLSKVYERLLNKKLREHIERDLDEAQSGFRTGHSIQDHIFAIKQVIQKSGTKNTELNLAFLDLEKAFDSVPRSVIWDSLEKKGINTHLRKCIQSMFDGNICYIRKDHMSSESFGISDGLRQGGVLSPTLFIMVMDDIIKAVKGKTKKVHVDFYQMRAIDLSACAFADDLCYYAPAPQITFKTISTSGMQS
nr:unnamed protein product [Callosobruchus chinensis]